MNLTHDGALSRDELLEAEIVRDTGRGLEGSSRAWLGPVLQRFATPADARIFA